MSYHQLPTDGIDVECSKDNSEISKEHLGYRPPKACCAIQTTTLTLIALSLCWILLCIGITTRLFIRHCSPGLPLNNYTLRSYGTNTRYMSLSHQYDDLWNSEMSDHNALVVLSTQPDFEEHGAISMFHQLHCLASIRAALQEAIEGKDIGVDQRDDLHWPYCLYDLRQIVLCFAEPTVEHGLVVNETRTNAISGADETRVCRDPTWLYEWRKRDGIKEFRGRNEL